MKISVTGRHMDVTDVMREYALEKAEKLTKYFENIQRVEIILNPEKEGRFSAELVVHAPRGSVLVVHAVQMTATAAVDTALDKMERHLTKLKDKLKKTGRKEPARKFARSPIEESAGDDSGEIWW
jgi:putative sigma-54 modulation protein